MSDNNKVVADNKALIKDLENFNAEFAKEFLERVKRRTRANSGTMRDGFEMTVDEKGIKLTNEVVYTSVFEFGNDKIRPDRMVGATVDEVDQIVKKVTKDKR